MVRSTKEDHMNGRTIVAALAVAAGLGAAALGAVALGTGAQAAAPVAAPVQTDYTECIGDAVGGGYITCHHDAPVSAQNAAAFAQLISPSGGKASLPSSARLISFVYAGVNDPGTPQDDRTIVGSTWRWFSHQVTTDATGNTRLNEYNGGLRFYIRTTGRTNYCDANPCS
jgi:hypothetical protein